MCTLLVDFNTEFIHEFYTSHSQTIIWQQENETDNKPVHDMMYY
jgi:hypothetical protein